VWSSADLQGASVWVLERGVDVVGPTLLAECGRPAELASSVQQAGWTVVRVWEHDTVAASVATVRTALALADA
jgi:hypothetical protein